MSNRIQWTIEGPVNLLDLSHLLDVPHPSLVRSFSRFTANAAPIKIESKPVTVPSILAGRMVKTYEISGLTALAFLGLRGYCNFYSHKPITLLWRSYMAPKAKHCDLMKSFGRFAAHFPQQIKTREVTELNLRKTQAVKTLELDPITLAAFNYYYNLGGRLPSALLSLGTARTIESAENGAKGRD